MSILFLRRILKRRIQHRDLVGLRILRMIRVWLLDNRFVILKRLSLTFWRLRELWEWQERILREHWKL